MAFLRKSLEVWMLVDVAIIGGGPAGCSAALTLRQRGLSVVIIDAAASRSKPTETSIPALAQMLKDLAVPGALEACEPCYGIQTSWGRSSQVVQPSISNPFGHAWFVHRAGFDEILRNECVE